MWMCDLCQVQHGENVPRQFVVLFPIWTPQSTIAPPWLIWNQSRSLSHYSYSEVNSPCSLALPLLVQSPNLLMYNVIVCVCFFNLFLLLGLVVKSLSGWGSEMNTAYCDTIPHPECMHTSTNTLSFPLSWPGALVCVVLRLPKSSVDIFKHGAVWMLFLPPSTIWCVSFFVCVLIPLLRPSCAAVSSGLEWRSCVIFGSSGGWWLLRREETGGG